MAAGRGAGYAPPVDDDTFVDRVADTLAGLEGVRAVALGGSRAQLTHRPDSDWDLSVYYRGHFDPQLLRDVGWPGEVSELGGWGGGVYNGGAWLTIDRRKVDVHYRDLDEVEHWWNEARRGRFLIEQLLFHLVGIPTYLVVAELAVNQILRGDLPRPDYPQRLRETAPQIWSDRAEATLDYALANHAPAGRTTLALGLAAQATACWAHAIIAARGHWITNDKRLLTAADVNLDDLFARPTPDPESLISLITEIRNHCSDAVHDAQIGDH